MGISNTAKDGTGTPLWAIVNSNGYAIITGASSSRILIQNDGGVQELTPLSAVARTTDAVSADLSNPGARGVMLTIGVSTWSAVGGGTAPKLTPKIQFLPEAASTYVNLFTAAATLGLVAEQRTYVLYPGNISTVGDVTEVIPMALPKTWRVKVTHGASTVSITYFISGSYLA